MLRVFQIKCGLWNWRGCPIDNSALPRENHLEFATCRNGPAA